MGSENEELYLMKLKRFIYDEDKIVTATWLSKKLELDIHVCQNLLKQFVNDETSSKNQFGITYTLTGQIESNDKNSIMLVTHEKLNEKKKLFKEIKSELVYSIQKAKDINFNSIGLVDLFNIHGDTKPILGCAVGKNCVRRPQLGSKKVIPTLNRAPGTDKSKASHLFATNGNAKNLGVKAETSKSVTETSTHNEEVIPKEKKETGKKLTKQSSGDKDKNKNSLANMFANAPPPKEKPSKATSQESQSSTEVMEVDADCDMEEVPIANNKTKANDLYDSGTDEEAKKIEEDNMKKNMKKDTSTKKKNNARSKRQRDKSAEMPQKKRKRIVNHVDSDDDIFVNENDDEEQDESIGIIESEEEVVKPAKPLAPKNKKRKYVDKTFEDEQGYIVTKNVLVYESNEETDENEAPEPPKQQESKQTSKKSSQKEINEPSPPKRQGKKKQVEKPANQPTLMNFFKKK